MHSPAALPRPFKKPLLACLLLFLLCTLLPQGAAAQVQGYWVHFTDKDTAVSPAADFDAKALARRARLGIPFPQCDDYPVNAAYVAQVGSLVAATGHESRWLNAVAVQAAPQQVAALRALPFVQRVSPMEALQPVLAAAEWPLADGADSTMLHRLFEEQRELTEMAALEKAGLSGRGVRIAIFDAGFSGADAHVAFAHLRQNGQIKKTYDFVGDDEDVYAHSNHGTAVLSCIAGLYEGCRIGAAVDAEFLLARTERNLREPKAEEDFWMAAMEWADREGADIISSSLGYAKPRYEYADMTGEKTLVTRAAAMAVRKGILVVNSAGNEGAGKFRYIAAPADADSVLTVAASYPMLAYRMPFSSIGPNARGVIKPEIAAPGYVLGAHKSGEYHVNAGTSFACPLMAGMAACLMQRWPDEDNMQIRQRILEAGSTYPYFDFDLGYGVFQAGRALADSVADSVAPNLKARVDGDTVFVQIDKDALIADSARYKSGKPFRFRIVYANGSLGSYRTLLVKQADLKLVVPRRKGDRGKLEIWFQGYWWREE